MKFELICYLKCQKYLKVVFLSSLRYFRVTAKHFSGKINFNKKRLNLNVVGGLAAQSCSHFNLLI